MKSIYRYSTIIFLLIALGPGCQQWKESSTTSGSITVAIDESIATPIDSVLRKFESLYKDAHVTRMITTSREAVILLSEKKVQLAFLGRDLLKDEAAVLNQNSSEKQIMKYKIAVHALGLMVNASNQLHELSMETLTKIFHGQVDNWNEIGGRKAPIHLAMTGLNSTSYAILSQMHVLDSLHCNYEFVARSSQVDSVLIAKPNTIGIQPLAWISSDTNRVRSLEVMSTIPEDTAKRIYPIGIHLANIYRERYPLRATIYAIVHDEGVNLPLGIISFFTSATGQKLLLQNGVVPATMPVRLVQFGENSGE